MSSQEVSQVRCASVSCTTQTSSVRHRVWPPLSVFPALPRRTKLRRPGKSYTARGFLRALDLVEGGPLRGEPSSIWIRPSLATAVHLTCWIHLWRASSPPPEDSGARCRPDRSPSSSRLTAEWDSPGRTEPFLRIICPPRATGHKRAAETTTPPPTLTPQGMRLTRAGRVIASDSTPPPPPAPPQGSPKGVLGRRGHQSTAQHSTEQHSTASSGGRRTRSMSDLPLDGARLAAVWCGEDVSQSDGEDGDDSSLADRTGCARGRGEGDTGPLR